MDPRYEKLLGCLEQVRRQTAFVPEVAVVLGSGLGGFADEIRAEAVVEYGSIPGFPVSTVPMHRGRFVFGTLDGVKVAVMQGRVHYYEGYDISDVVLPVRLLGLLGAKTLLLTNAAGGVGEGFRPGDLMLITDHILSFAPNPLVGPNLEALGPRFPDMSHVYDPGLCERFRAAASELGAVLREGVYCQLTGPSFETPAEIRMLKVLGVSAVGMSTAVEAVAARHMGLRVCGISCISNLAAGISPTPLSHEEVTAAADAAAPVFQALLRRGIVLAAERTDP